MFHSSFIIFFFFLYTPSPAVAQSQEWPVGTVAIGSTTHPPLDGAAEGQFKPENAIDNDATTKWNDDTEEGVSTKPYPDIFTLSLGSIVNLEGIMLLSGSDGWIRNYTVETSQDGGSWVLASTVTLSDVVLRFIRFDNGPLDVKQLRVNITAAMAGYSRISELRPVYAAAASASKSNSNATINPLVETSTTTAPTTVTTTTTPRTPSGTNSNTIGIIAGVLGGLAGILLGVLAYFLWLMRKQRNSVVGTGVEGTGQTVAVGGGGPQKSPVSGFSFRASQLGGQYPQELGNHPRTELA